MIRLDEKTLVRFLIAEISIPAIKYYLIQGTRGMYVYNDLANLFISIVLLVLLLPALVVCYRRKSVSTILIASGFIVTILFQIIIFPENKDVVLSYLPKIFGMSMGCLIVSSCVRDYDLLKKDLTSVSYLIILAAFYQFFTHTFLGVRGIEKADYDMSFVFFLVVPCIMIFNSLYELKGFKRVLASVFYIVGVVIAVLMGSRGGVLAVILGTMICAFIHAEKLNVKKLVTFFIGAVFLFVVFYNFNSIATELSIWLEQFGINSRLLQSIIRGRLTWSAGRDELQSNVWSIIQQNFWFGTGMLSDLSSHNVFLESMLFFGVPLGIIFSIIIILNWLKIVFLPTNSKRILMCAFLAYSFVDSNLNLTVLGKDMFWIYLGLSLSYDYSQTIIGEKKGHSKIKLRRI